MGLGIFFNANLNEAMYTFNLVNKFSNVLELNLSAFGQESYLSCLLDHTCALDALSNCLTELKHLKRLRLNIPGCKNRLGYILANLTCPLEYLNLTSCGLGEQDLDFLANSMHTQSINNLVLSNNDLGNQCNAVIRLLRKMASNMQILDLGCNSFQFDAYFKIVNEVIVKMDNLRMLVTLDVFKFDHYVKIAEKLSLLDKFVSWRINYSSDYYEKSAKIKNRYKFKKFKQDYVEALERKFSTNNASRSVKITINDPDLNFILNGISHN